MVDFGQRPGGLHGSRDLIRKGRHPKTIGEGQHPKVCSAYLYVVVERAVLSARYRNHIVADGQSDFCAGTGSIDPAVRIDDLRIDRRATELAGRCAKVLEIVWWGGLDLCGGRL